MKKIIFTLVMAAACFRIFSEDTDITRYIDASKKHEIRWMTYVSPEGKEVKAETTIDLPDLFFGHYTNTDGIKSWRQAQMEFYGDGTGWFRVEKGGFDTELDPDGNSVKKTFKWGIILNEDRTIHIIDNADNPRFLNDNEIMCVFLMDDGQAAVWHIMI